MTGYRKIDVAELPNTPNPTSEKKQVDEAVGATEFGFNVYTAKPGERIPWGYHAHPDHEELFYVISGELVVETAEGEFRVGPDEAFFVPRGQPNLARAGDETVRLIAVGAPKDSDGAVISEECPACGEIGGRDYDVRSVAGTETYVLSCPSCGQETDRFTA